MDLKDFFTEVTGLVSAKLDTLIPAAESEPQSLRDAMRWSLFAGGKHFRPALVFAAGRTFGAADESIVRTAAAVEMIHTYSLIHDDLPSMDDDDLRRGRETCHKKYGEATAILAGDALQVLSFQAIAEDVNLGEGVRVKLISGLARAAARMVVGQQHDLESEGRDLSIDEVEQIHVNKTGALIAFSARAGALIADAHDDEFSALSAFAERIGLLFQITDDILDITISTERLGKTAGKDIAAKKATYPGVLGITEARKKVESVYKEAMGQLSQIRRPTETLGAIAAFLVSRNS